MEKLLRENQNPTGATDGKDGAWVIGLRVGTANLVLAVGLLYLIERRTSSGASKTLTALLGYVWVLLVAPLWMILLGWAESSLTKGMLVPLMNSALWGGVAAAGGARALTKMTRRRDPLAPGQP